MRRLDITQLNRDYKRKKGLFEVGHSPGGPGIYQCQGCGYEDVINRACDKLPPCSRCEKNEDWKLLFEAQDSWRDK